MMQARNRWNLQCEDGGMAIKAIIFDIDGVLADSREAVVQNTIEVLNEFGHSALRPKVERMSSAHSAESVLISLVPGLAEDRALLKRMLLRLSEVTKKNMRLVKPALLASALPGLSEKYLLAAATNRKASAQMVLEHLGILKYFKAVVTSADAPHKPDPGMILLALSRLGVKPGEAVFFGDNKEDVQAGEAAGVRTVMLEGVLPDAEKKVLQELKIIGA